MTQVSIIHNPFTVETTFLIDGVELTDGARLHRCTKLRMQLWVDQLFHDLKTMFNGHDTFNVIFTGVEPDFRDLEVAAQAARDANMKVNLQWVPAESAEARQAEVESLRAQVLEHPGYASVLKDDAVSRAALHDLGNNDFDVYIVATMSSGKSTLINAMLGRDLLPAGNEATTATITRIYHDESVAPGQFRGRRFDASNELLDESENLDLATMRAWNKDPETSLVEVHGPIQAARGGGHARLVLTDTPGPNNGSDQAHGVTTMRYIQDTTRNPLILYVLNATQRGITDDSRLLKLVAQTIAQGGRQASDRFIFVLNKMDTLDDEAGDDVAGMLARTRQYLQEHGIHNPQIFPVSAYASRLIRFPEAVLSSKERCGKASFLEWFQGEPSMDLAQYAPLRVRERTLAGAGDAAALERRSGLPALESTVGAYIEKYHLPDRFKRSHDAVARLVDEAINRHKAIEDLEAGNVQALAAEVEKLRARYERGVDGQALAEQLSRDHHELTKDAEAALVTVAGRLHAYAREDMAKFQGDVTPAQARQLVKEWGEHMNSRHKEVLGAYQLAFEAEQETLKKDLQSRYHALVSSSVGQIDAVQFPALARLMRSAGNLSFAPAVTSEHIETRSIRKGTREVMDRKLFNPISWFKPKVEIVYGEEKYVDLVEFYKTEHHGPTAHFKALEKTARAAMVREGQKLREVFVEHVRTVFQPRVAELFDQAQARIEDRDLRVAALAEATELRRWSETIRQRLGTTLAVQEVHG
ncbi:dynamin family protein [Stenotrophomonas sp. PUT21]|uniref:dynamin family protein n=1 Tax=Stenotrophomonas TaxID=40323 RepID=UPI003B7CC3BA